MNPTILKEKEVGKGNNNLVMVFLLGFAFGVGFMWFFSGEEVLSPSVVDNTAGDSSINGQGVANTSLAIDDIRKSSIVVMDQLAGDRVFVKELTMNDTGWIVVHESLPDGGLGNALGARRYIKGIYTDASVGLLRNTEVGKTYHMVFYNDSGGAEFTLGEDTPVLDENGDLFETTFEVIRINRKI